MEAKRLASSIAALRSEMGKIEEQLQECQRWGAGWVGATLQAAGATPGYMRQIDAGHTAHVSCM